jgi:hypothetical protein
MRNKRRALDMSRLGLFHLQKRKLEHMSVGKEGESAPEEESGAHEQGENVRKWLRKGI